MSRSGGPKNRGPRNRGGGSRPRSPKPPAVNGTSGCGPAILVALFLLAVGLAAATH